MTEKAIINGVVEQVYEREVNTRYGAKPAYAVKVNGETYSAGFKKLGCAEGDTVQFTIVQKGEYWNVEGAVELVAKATAEVAKVASKASGSAKDERITFISARNAAMEFTKLAVETGALKLPAKDKEGVLVGYVQKYTNEFFVDVWVDEVYKDFVSVDEEVPHIEEEKGEE